MRTRIANAAPARLACLCLVMLALLGHNAPVRSEEKPNIAGDAQIYVSSAPNPAWTPAQAVDGLVDINHGWIASADNGAQPWIALEFPDPVRVETIVFHQAGLTEAGENRFARPRRIRVEMDGVEPRTVTLEDRERVAQRLTVAPTPTSVIKIDILSTYPDARFPFLTGFQEIEVYEGGLSVSDTAASAPPSPQKLPDPAPAPETPDNEDQALEDIESTVLRAGKKIEDRAPADAAGGQGLTAQERELLLLLQEFTAKLEQYMRDN